MRKTVRDGSYIYEILGKDESILNFSGIPEATAFLRRFSRDTAQLMVFRSLLASCLPNPHTMSTEEAIKACAALMVSGQIKIIRSAMFLSAGTGAAEAATTRQESQSAPAAAPKKKTWIEIHLRDAQGQPVQGERYRIKLPDGSIEEGNLDDFGHAEYYEINPGTCEISFPNLEDEEWFLG